MSPRKICFSWYHSCDIYAKTCWIYCVANYSYLYPALANLF